MSAIKTVALKKCFKDVTAVESLDLEINEGELFALLGVNGAGKTTTIKMLSCLTTPSSGEATVCSYSVTKDSAKVKEIIGVSPQETAVAGNLSVRENLELMAGIYNFDKEKVERKTNQMLDEFSLKEVENRRAKTLSGGWQRRLSIAMALICEPKVLFLDEPTLGLDVLARRELWREIEKLKGNITIILTTHYMEEAQALSDRIAIMVSGSLRALGTAESLMQQTNTDNFEDAFIAIAQEGQK